MWSKRFSLLFYLRKPKNYVRGKQLFYMRAAIGAARLKLPTYRECEPDRWNSQASRARGTKDEFRELNAYLDSWQAKVSKVHRGLIDWNEPVTIENLKDILRVFPKSPGKFWRFSSTTTTR